MPDAGIDVCKVSLAEIAHLSSWAGGDGVPDSSIAIHRVESECSQSVRMAIVIGTPITAPGVPQRKLQKNTAKITREARWQVQPRLFGARDSCR